MLHDANKNERKGEGDEPGPGALVLGEVDVVTGGKQSNQTNNAADYGLQQGGAEPRFRQTTPSTGAIPKTLIAAPVPTTSQLWRPKAFEQQLPAKLRP